MHQVPARQSSAVSLKFVEGGASSVHVAVKEQLVNKCIHATTKFFWFVWLQCHGNTNPWAGWSGTCCGTYSATTQIGNLLIMWCQGFMMDSDLVLRGDQIPIPCVQISQQHVPMKQLFKNWWTKRLKRDMCWAPSRNPHFQIWFSHLWTSFPKQEIQGNRG